MFSLADRSGPSREARFEGALVESSRRTRKHRTSVCGSCLDLSYYVARPAGELEWILAIFAPYTFLRSQGRFQTRCAPESRAAKLLRH